MIDVVDSYDIFDILYQCAAENTCVYIYFTNNDLDRAEQSVKDKVYAYYEDFLPDDLLLTIKTGDDNIIKMTSQDSAIISAKEWFPTKTQLGDKTDEYYFKCYVVDKQSIIYQN